jgi:recombinational DNA repair protein (RecF pathway)
VELLLEHEGITPLIAACSEGHVSVVELLLEHEGITPLIAACSEGARVHHPFDRRVLRGPRVLGGVAARARRRGHHCQRQGRHQRCHECSCLRSQVLSLF